MPWCVPADCLWAEDPDLYIICIRAIKNGKIMCTAEEAATYTGLKCKLDVGLYQLDQQVACQRHRQTILDAESKLTAAIDKALAARDALTQKFAFQAA